MTAWSWISKPVVLAIHAEQIAEHGGETGLRGEGLLDSALARPVNRAAYAEADVCALAAAYGFGLSRNHPFIDGNKRVSFVTMELFLALNGFDLAADDADCLEVALALSASALDETDLARWLRRHAAAI